MSGKFCSGKLTVARLIQQLCAHLRLVERSYAYRLKQGVAAFAGVPIEATLTEEGKNTAVAAFGRTLGQLLQEIGTDFRNRYNPNLWVDLLLQVSNTHQTTFPAPALLSPLPPPPLSLSPHRLLGSVRTHALVRLTRVVVIFFCCPLVGVGRGRGTSG